MSRDAFMTRDEKKGHSSYRRSKKQEKSLALRGGGQLVPGSGSGAQKGDIKKYNGVLRIEAKTTQAKSFSVTREMVRKIEEAALPNGELPAIVIEFNDGMGNPEMEIAVVPLYILDSITK
jgi:Holliday junction resolvase